MVTESRAVYSFDGLIRVADLRKDIVGRLYFCHGKMIIQLPKEFQPKLITY